MGLVISAALAVYLVILVSATWLAYRWATKRGLSLGRRWLVAAGGFLLVYLPVFWDHVPTLIAHQYYCQKEAGFWIHKSPGRWEEENPGVKSTLVRNKKNVSSFKGDNKIFTSTHHLNQRFDTVLKKQGPLPVNLWRWEQQLVDTKTGEAMARRVDFSTGTEGRMGGEPEIRFWLQSNGCSVSAARAKAFADFVRQFRGRSGTVNSRGDVGFAAVLDPGRNSSFSGGCKFPVRIS